jgi:predicted nucleic-acid-binding Zn-ribbon protein
MPVCRNCQSTELYVGDISVEMTFRFKTPWMFKLQVCADCGLSDWFLASKDHDWVRENFSRVNASPGAASPKPSDT